jgi:hypothetical protein
MGYIDSMKTHELQRFNLKQTDNFTVKTDVARPYINRELQMKERLGPY